MQEAGENKAEIEGGEEYWRNKCSELQQQVEVLTVANKLLGHQLQTKAAQNRQLRTRSCQDVRSLANGQSCFPVFPEELWEIILEYLGDSQDLLNVCKTCDQLDAVLNPSKSSWMFQFIIGDVVKKLSRDDILNCRLVCKKWSAAIDTFLENHPSRRPFSHDLRNTQNDNLLSSKKLTNSCIFHLWDADRIRTIREEMKRHPRNPFIGRSVVFNVEIDEDFDEEDEFDDPGIVEFWELAKTLLCSVGNHIWFIELTEDSGHQKPLEFYKLLRELLSWLPNLRSLKLAVDISHEDYHPKALPLYMANYPLPVMPHLESLDIECFYPEVPQIIHDILIAMYSAQLYKLHINSSRWKSSYSRGFIRLTELHVKEVSLGRLTILAAPNLGKICLDLRQSSSSLASPTFKFSTHSLFETLSRFSTLRVLKLLVDIAVELEDISGAAYQLCSIPSLEQLEVYGIQRKISYSFLLCFPSLKSISIRESTSANKFNEDPAVIAFLEGDSHSHEEVVEVQKYMYTGRMYESNIWKVIPSLEIFSFKRVRYGDLIFIHKCSREMYDYRLKTGTVLTEMIHKIPFPINCNHEDVKE